MQRTTLLTLVFAFFCTAGSSSCSDKATPESKAAKAAETPSKEPVAPEPEPPFTGEVFEDEGYRFRLKSPGPDWKLMGREDIRNISPDGAAGLSDISGVTGVVIVEHSPKVELSSMADVVIGNMPVEGKVVSQREQIEYAGLPAIKYVVEGRVNDIPMVYHGRLFLRGDYVYQVIALSPGEIPEQDKLDAIFKSFELTEGEIKIVDDGEVTKDAIGIGWRLQDGVFESATTGLRLKPTGSWRVVVGAEAKRINADAEAVMLSKVPEAYFIIVPELIGKASKKTYRAGRVDQTVKSMDGEVKQKNDKAKLLNKDVEVTLLKSGSFPWTFSVAVGFHDKLAIQATGWYNSSFGDEGQSAIKEAMAAISFMSKRDQKSLTKKLLSSAENQNRVGEGHALRGGVFRDFARGVTWTKPKGFWDITIGQEVRAINPVAQVYARYNNSAMHLLIVAEHFKAGDSAEKYHKSAVAAVEKNLSLAVSSRAKKAKLGSGGALQSDSVASGGGVELSYRVITSVKGSTAVQLHMWGANSRKKSLEPIMQAAAKNLVLAPIQASSQNQKKGSFRDNRLGFSMSMPRRFKYIDNTPAEIAGIGSFPAWGKDGEDWVGILALCALEDGRDDVWFMDFMEQRIRDSFGKLVLGVKATEDSGKLAGRSARHLWWLADDLRLDAYLIIRDRTIYALLSTDSKKSTDMRDTALRGFRLID